MITPRIPSEPSSSRSGLGPAPGARQPPALPRPGRRDRAHRLDQVVDVRVERGEVPAGAGRDPAAERRELERLREVAQRERRARAAGPRDAGPARRPGSAPRARRGRPRAPGRGGAGRSSPRRRSRRRPRLDAAHHAGAAAVRDHRQPRARRTSRARARRRARRAGSATRSGGWSSGRESARTTSR